MEGTKLQRVEKTKKESFSLSSAEKKFCVSLAKRSIEYSFTHEGLLRLNDEELALVPKKLLEKKACFVTLMINNKLKGCIGHLVPVQLLFKDIISNAYSAAFSDIRFNPLEEKEFESLTIEVSILTDPIDLKYSDSKDLLKKIVAGKDGLIIRKGYFSATFLPSVWEDLPKKEDFLSELCQKAGLSPKEWQKGDLIVQRYYAIKAK